MYSPVKLSTSSAKTISPDPLINVFCNPVLPGKVCFQYDPFADSNTDISDAIHNK